MFWIVTACGGLFAILHLITAFTPSGLSWGVHLLSFFPLSVKVIVPALMLLALIPGVQRGLVGLIQYSAEKFRDLPRPVKAVFLISLVAGAAELFWMLKQQTFFLGDGRLAMRNLGDVHSVDVIPIGFKNVPLTGYILWKLASFLTTMKFESSIQLAFQFLSIGMGAASVVVVLLLVRRLSPDSTERVLAYLLVVGSAGSQLFFGYVEAYTPAYFSFLLFVWLTLSYLDGGLHPAFPSVAFGILVVSHFGMVIFIPAFLFLLYREATLHRYGRLLISAAAFLGTATLLLWISGYTVELIRSVFLGESGSHFVSATPPQSGWNAYTLPSLWHVLDLLNLYALVGPFSLIILLVLGAVIVRKTMLKDPRYIFFSLVALGGAAFSFLMNFDIGMSRDWDLLSPYVLAVILASVFFWLSGVESQNDRFRLLAMMAAITLLHTATFVSLNADGERSIARFEILPDGRLWGSNARAYAYEDLSAYYRDRHEHARASEFTEECLAADSTSSRRWVNASVVFQNSGEKEKEIRAYEKAIQLGTQFAWVYGNLGSEYITLGRIDEADTLLRRALELDPKLPMAAYNLGSLLGNKKHSYGEGFYYLSRAVETDSAFPSAWLNAGTCLYEMGRFREMVPYYRKFVQLAPDHPLAPAILRLIESAKANR